jgi:hypothetical protein
MRSVVQRIFVLAGIAPLILAQLAAAPATTGAPVPGRPSPQAGSGISVLKVDWGKAQQDQRAQIQKGQPARLERTTPQQLAGVHMPVLLPNTPEFRAGVRMFPSSDSYAATLSLSGTTVEIFGSRLASSLSPATEKAASHQLTANAAGYVVSATEYGQELSFSRYGVAYSMSVTCDAPQTDERCAKPDFLTGLADNMQMFGGTPDGGN